MHCTHPCIAGVGDLYQPANEHDGENGYLKSTSIGFRTKCAHLAISDKDFTKQILDLPLKNTAKNGMDALDNGSKRCSDNFCGELVNKRAKIEGQDGKQWDFVGKPPISSIFLKEMLLSEVSERKCFSGATYNTIKANVPQAPPAGGFASAFPGFEYFDRIGSDQLENVPTPISELSRQRHLPVGMDHHSRRKCIPVGVAHQAVLPQWLPHSYKSSHFDAGHSSRNIATPLLMDKRMGSCVVPMPKLYSTLSKAQLCFTNEGCDCLDEGSTRCVRQHVTEAREKLSAELGKKKFTELGISDMGEDVARLWAYDEEKMFHMLMLSNSASSGRNFWMALTGVFPYRRFKEIVSYYFNVFVLRKRAEQNRTNPLNADSDDDEFELSDEDGNDSVVESEEEDDEFYCDSMKTIDRSFHGDCLLDKDAEDDSCTSFDRDQENRHVEYNESDCRATGFVDYEYADAHHAEQKPWEEVNYMVGATEKEFDFFPTCNVIEVFGKRSKEDDGWGDGDLM